MTSTPLPTPETAESLPKTPPKARKTAAKAPKTASKTAKPAKKPAKTAKSAEKAPKKAVKTAKTASKAAKTAKKTRKTAEIVSPDLPKSPRRVWEPLVREACEALSARKGVDIVALDVEGRTSVCDALVVATAMNAPHLRALADEVAKRLRAFDPPRAPYRKSGERTSNWIALDYIDFIVHVLSADARRYYDLEGLWPDAPRLPFPGKDA